MTASAASSVNVSTAALPVVLHVCDAEAYARFGRMFRQLTLATAEEGARVLLVTDSPALIREVETTHVSALQAALRGIRSWRLGHLIDEFFEDAPQVIHAWGTGGLAGLGLWAERRRLPLMIHVTRPADAAWINRHGLSGRHQLALASAELGEPLRARWSSQVALATRLPPALLLPDVDAGDPGAVAADGTATLGVLWSGSFVAGSGVELLVEALRLLPEDGPRVQVALLGEGPMSRSIWRRLSRARLLGRVSIIPDPIAWNRLMSAADVLVVPLRDGTVSLAPLLAMALGRLVVAPADTRCEWLCEPGCAWHFEPRSPAALAECLTRAATDRAAAQATGRVAREYVRRNHAIAALGTALVGMYQSMIARSR